MLAEVYREWDKSYPPYPIIFNHSHLKSQIRTLQNNEQSPFWLFRNESVSNITHHLGPMY